MGKALRDFTVAELDALPAGARFVDRSIDRTTWNEWTFTKRQDGRWKRPDSSIIRDSEWFLDAWGDDPYTLDEACDDSIAADPDPLSPFANLATEITAETPDDFALFSIGDKFVTAGDFRRAALALRS